MTSVVVHCGRCKFGNRSRQRGLSIVAAIFLVVVLSVVGVALVQLTAINAEESVSEWYSAQALYAAESGVQWSARDLSAGGAGAVSNADVVAGAAWVTTTVGTVVINGRRVYTITSVGAAGGTATTPRAVRRIVVDFMP